MDRGKQGKLQAFLAVLPDRQAAELLAACEAAVRKGTADRTLTLVHETLAARTELFIERAFGAVMPLVTPEGGPKRPGRIARSSLYALAKLAEELAPKICADLRAGTPPVNAHREALGRVLRGSLRNDERGEARFLKRLGGERGFEDACDISALLCAEPELSDGLAGFPQRIADLDPAMARRARDLHDAIQAKERHAPLLFHFLLLERLQKPAHILRLLKKIAALEDDLLASQTDVSALGDALLDEVEAAVSAMTIAPHVTPDGPAIVSAIARFAAVSRGMTRELGIRRDGKWGMRLAALRNLCARSMDALCSAAPRAIDQALPRARVQLGAGAPAMRPDISGPPGADACARGLNYATILGGVGEHSSSCAFAAEYGKAREAAERIVHTYCDGLIELLQFCDDAMLPAAEEWRSVADRFVAALFDAKATAIFHRRAAAAVAARTRAAVA